MALQFFFTIGTMVSLGAVLYLIARALPRVSDEAFEDRKRVLHTPWMLLCLERCDEWLKGSAEKSLRRLRVWLLRLDNGITGALIRFKKQEEKRGAPFVRQNGDTSEKKEH